MTVSGPPPKPPTPSAEHVDSRVARKRKQAELLKKGQDMRALESGKGGGSAKTKRFWKDVHVKHEKEGLQIYLDTRPLRRPSKAILTIPHQKPHLASAIALEWDLLVSAQQALRHHLIPLTSLVSRALDIADEDAAGPSSGDIRANIVKTVMRYLDTDSLLCWAPEASPDPPGYETHVGRTESLRSIQKRTAESIISFLTERVWPGVVIIPVLDEGSIMPRSQPQMTKDVIQGWVSGLPAFELAGLERAVLAGKGLLGAARLLVEWSTELAHLRDEGTGEKFGVEEAARAATLEVVWQTGMWGEVEDTHDVEKEDVRRQLGSVILLVSGQQA
ncbi:Protein atp12, mitochondrial [Lachnellula hyalina]|uniref:Protein atp12, mitochondrial n=1 Tax=Lachnellula hyalina TaxID=1316788 RepID=A0A8H8R9V6_9HELO|nr:Protein atp12, mitochondrial [Lachnellula hyalina]TVY31031.1 Protein atp12, mitochondrial [Lachnellula hyalina]